MFADEVQNLAANVCLFVHAVGWNKPNYASLSFLAVILYGVSCCFLAFSVNYFFIVSTMFKCTFVVWFCFVKEFFV